MAKSKEKELKIKRQPTFDLTLTKMEVIHLRDLMSILLPPDGQQTLSQSLAASEDRPLVESKLWKKIVAVCNQANLPIGDEAPDYIVAPTSTPALGVFQVHQEVDDSVEGEDGEGFLPEETEEEDE